MPIAFFIMMRVTQSADPFPSLSALLPLRIRSFPGCRLLLENFDIVVQFMLQHSANPEYRIRLIACDFWSSSVRVWHYRTGIQRVLPQIVPILLQNMKYSEADYLNMYDRDDDAGAVDHSQDIQPRFHHSKKTTVEDEENDDDDDAATSNQRSGTAWGSEWTCRKASACSLDTLAGVFQDEVMGLVLPIIGTNMDSADWEVQESAVLAIGAIGVGCLYLMYEHLPRVTHLLTTQTIHHDQPLLRTISCWCLSRYGTWICNTEGNEAVFRETLKAILTRMGDRSKRVQDAACSAMATLCECGPGFVPYIADIIATFDSAFLTYQVKNMFVLYDACGRVFRRELERIL